MNEDDVKNIKETNNDDFSMHSGLEDLKLPKQIKVSNK